MASRRVVKGFLFLILSLCTGLALGGGVAVAAPVTDFTVDFDLDDCTFANDGRNPYFSLVPGDELLLEGDDDGETVVVRIRVLNATRTIKFRNEDGEQMQVVTRVVEEREWVDDELVEVSRNFYARCKETNDIFYFGENVDIYEDGQIVSHDGAWLAGKQGALPGIIMPGRFLLGSRYYQELAPGVALDRAEHKTMGMEIDVPAGSFEDCVEIIETTPLEPGHESRKVYCEGIGLVIDSVAELVDFEIDDEDD
jgi:hypothetical protein